MPYHYCEGLSREHDCWDKMITLKFKIRPETAELV